MSMRRLSGSFVPTRVNAAVRSMRDAKGVTEMRVTTHLWPKTPEEAITAYQAKLASEAHPSPSNKKEEWEHLARRPGYEYIPEFQRWANDMMAIYSDPLQVTSDMSYHYHRVWKCLSPNHTWFSDGSGSFEIVRVKPFT